MIILYTYVFEVILSLSPTNLKLVSGIQGNLSKY